MRKPRISFAVHTLHCNLAEFLPKNKQKADDFLRRACEELMKLLRITKAEPSDTGVTVTFEGLTSTQVARLERAIDEVIDDLYKAH